MKLYTFEFNAQRSIGAEWEGQIIDLPAAYRALLASQGPKTGQLRAIPSEMLSLIRLGTLALEAALATIAFIRKRPAVPVGEQLVYPFEAVKVLAPIPRPGKILCCAGTPLVFYLKLPSAVIGPGEPIVKPAVIEHLDAAPGCAAIIGRRMKSADDKDALSHLFGYTLFLDVATRDPRLADNLTTLGKNFDSFCPLGPCIVTADEVPFPNPAQLHTAVNDTTFETPVRSDPGIQFARALSYLSTVMSLEPGDILGMVDAVGATSLQSSRVNLSPGDRISVEHQNIGRLENPAIAETPR